MTLTISNLKTQLHGLSEKYDHLKSTQEERKLAESKLVRRPEEQSVDEKQANKDRVNLNAIN